MEEIFDNYLCVYLLCVSVAVNLKTQREFNFISLLSGSNAHTLQTSARPRFDLQNIRVHALCHCGSNLLLKVAHAARACAFFSAITEYCCCLISWRKSGVWVLGVKSALISNNQGEVPLRGQSWATSHMFLAHRLALHHVLKIATTRDKRRNIGKTAGAAGLGGWGKPCKTLHQDFFARQGVSKIVKLFQKENWN